MEQHEGGGRDSGEQCLLLCLTARQSIFHSVGGAMIVLDPEVESNQFTQPLVLWNGCQPLIK
jgi:hypothetical protein